MPSIRIERYSEPHSFLIGLGKLRRSGVTPRGLLFLALDSLGAVHLAVPEDVEDVTRIKVGEKLGLVWPSEGRFFHYDSIHRLRDHYYVFNGDRRLQHPGDSVEVAGLICDFLKSSSAKNVFFGCTSHQPGSWLVGERVTLPLHEAGFVEVVPVAQGLLARRIMDHRLWLRTFASLVGSERVDGWEPIYESPLGNVLMLERRIINDRLVLTCERGLIELDVGASPAVLEVGCTATAPGFAVVGRVENSAFAVTRGKVEPWGLDGISPAVLIGAEGGELQALGAALCDVDLA